MIRQFLFNLFVNCKILDLILIYIIYLINFFVVILFGSRIGKIKLSLESLIKYGLIFSLFTFFGKPFINENIFSIILSIGLLLIFTFLMKPSDLKIFWKDLLKSAWIVILINIIVAVIMGLVCQPLTLILPQNFFISTAGIILGTVCEFLGMLILLLIFPRKEGRDNET